MPDTFYMKRNDLLPNYQVVLADVNGAIDLSTATEVKFTMRPIDPTDPVKIYAPATIISASEGIVQYEWVAGDTSDVGEFYAEFEINFSGKTMTLPNPDYNTVVIGEDLD